jgi:hypothetical protein
MLNPRDNNFNWDIVIEYIKKGELILWETKKSK